MRTTRSPGRSGRRPLAAIALVAVSGVILAGCAGSASPQASPSPSSTPATPTPTPTASPTPSTAPTTSGAGPTVPTNASPWGPTQAQLDAAVATAHALPLDEEAGLIIMARFSGTDPAAATQLVAQEHIGSLILFGDNVQSPSQVRALTDAAQAAGRSLGYDWPLAIGADDEGGTITRLENLGTSLPTFMTAGAAQDPAVVTQAYAGVGQELRAMGLTWDFAPDADVTIGPADPTIGSRSASSNPQTAANAVVAAQKGLQQAGLVPVAKHFPGHGSVTTDSHVSVPVQNASITELENRDWVPFKAAVEHGAPVVMMGHIDLEAVDPGVPTSLSPKAYQFLRDELGFGGVIVTDALDMGAVKEAAGNQDPAVVALAAGADVLLSPPSATASRDAIVAAVNNGTIARSRLDDAAGHLIALQRHFASAQPDLSVVGTHASDSQALSAAGVTLVSGAHSGRLVGNSIAVRGGTKEQWQDFVDAAGRAGLTVAPVEDTSATTVRLLSGGKAGAATDVAIALDTPYVLSSQQANTKIALYGDTPEAFDAVIAVLLGERSAPGTLPVTM